MKAAVGLRGYPEVSPEDQAKPNFPLLSAGAEPAFPCCLQDWNLGIEMPRSGLQFHTWPELDEAW